MMKTQNPLLKIKHYKQSIWLDYIERTILQDGTVQQLIMDDGLAGMTSNPSIFEKAITQTNDYTTTIAQIANNGVNKKELYEQLVIYDIQKAADLFRPAYDKSGGADGFVSMEVSPLLANETEPTIREARRLWRLLDRPNVMIKIPATHAGLPAIQQLVSDGINVNATLLFSLERYHEVAERFIAGLEARNAAGLPLEKISSVASFFLSRIDTRIDRLLDECLNADIDKAALAEELRGKTAIASARLAYQSYKQLFSGPRWETLNLSGARTQRLLWASTSTKDPAYSDVKYVEPLIGSGTVNTLPMETLKSFRDHGQVEPRLEEHVEQAHGVFNGLLRLGIDLASEMQQLEQEGVQKFVASYDKLLASLAQQQKTVVGL